MKVCKKIRLKSSNHFFLMGKKRIFNMFPSLCELAAVTEPLPVATVHCSHESQCLRSYRGYFTPKDCHSYTSVGNYHQLYAIDLPGILTTVYVLIVVIFNLIVVAFSYNAFWRPMATNSLSVTSQML